MASTPVRTVAIILAALLTLMAISCASAPPASKETSLTDLVLKGDLDGIKKYYSNQEQLNSRDGQGLYPLHYAVSRGDSQVAAILIALGSKPNVTDPSGKTPLRYAIDRNQVTMARMLVDGGADPFIADAAGMTPAETALLAGPDMTTAVFNGKNINASGADGRTALHMAADKLLETEVALLLDMGASAQTKDKADRSPLDLALLYPDRIEAARIAEKLILRGASPSFPEFAWFATAVRAVDYASVRYSNGNGPLHEAISRFQYGFASFLLSRKVSPNVRNLSGDAPLHFAVRSGWLEGAELLLSGGADPDIRDGKDNTPLHLTAPATARLQMTKLLLRFKADPSQKDAEGNTALHRAVKLSYEANIVETLIAGGSPVNSANLEGDTPLMIAVKAGGYQYAEPLIKAGADVFLRNVKGASPLSVAVERGAEAVDKIVLNENVHQRDNSGNGILATAVSLHGSPEVVTLILSKGADPNVRNNAGDGALHIAVRDNLGPQGVLLLEAKADVFAANAAQETPLILALTAKEGPYDWFFTPQVVASRDANGDSALHYAARKNLPAGIEYLIGKGADLKAVNAARETTLHAAVKTDAADAARLLISLGIDLASRDSMGDAPLNVAVMWSAEECLSVLVLSGADLDARNFSGEAAMHQAVRKGNRDALRFLIDRGANKEARDNRGQTPLSAAASGSRADLAQDLLTAGAEVDARENSGKTPLFGAVESGNLELVRLFVKAGADILARNAAGDSPLILAFRKGPAHVTELLTKVSANRGDSEGKAPLRLLVEAKMGADLVDTIVASGATPDGRDRFADTALHAAIRLGDYAMVDKLVKIGCDPFASNYQGDTPAKLAMDKGADALKALVTASGVDARDVLGNGYLHYAARAGKQQAAETLLELGVDKTMKTISGETAADIAASGNYQTLAAALR